MDSDAARQLHHPQDTTTAATTTTAAAGPSSSQHNHHYNPPGFLDQDSHLNPHDYGAYPQQPEYLEPPSGRFTEEWDASQRGSSILDGHRPNNKLAAMQRTASISSYAAGDDSSLPIRNNTLRKKGSVRRAGSLGRSASRRSNRAGSVRSLALQSSTDPDELHSAFFCPVPTSGNPTTALAERFQSKSS